jgi:glucosamine kinase
MDGGGSKTICAVADESSILATATAGPSNMVRVGEARARESLHQCVSQACTTAGIDPTQISYTCIGAAGAARPDVVNAVRRALGEILSSPIDVLGDMQIALEGAFTGGPGVVVIAGTGSIAYGRNEQGLTGRAGGHGAVTSDEGSGHWIGKRAVAAIESGEKARNGNDAKNAAAITPEFVSALEQAWTVGSVPELIRMARSEPAPNFAALFPAVLAAANSGDQGARNILQQAGAELAKLGLEVIRQIFSRHEADGVAQEGQMAAENDIVPLAMVGSVFRHAQLVREVFYNQLREHDSRIEMKPEVVDPIDGALRIARKSANKPVSR